MNDFGVHMEDFRALLNQLDSVHGNKILEYGLARYEGDLDHNLLAAFFDIDRKYIRLRHQMQSGQPLGLAVLRETFMDLASYGIMGMQIIDLVQQAQKKSKEEPK